MDPRKLFADERHRGLCIFCGGDPETRDHVPSRVLLDEPFPPNLPVAECCRECNNSFSVDEQYLACFLDCVITGTVGETNARRPKVDRILSENPTLKARIAAAEAIGEQGEKLWVPEQERIERVLIKLARGHLAYELCLPRLESPLCVQCAPIQSLDEAGATTFLSAQPTPFWPEIGSRSFIRACYRFPGPRADEWCVVQEGRYQYLVSQADGDFVRILISDYLACEVRWD